MAFNMEPSIERAYTNLKNALVARSCKLVTPSDTELIKEGMVIVLGNAGNVQVQTVTGDIVLLPLEAKEIVPLLVNKVFDTNTTATSIYILN